MAGPVPFDPRPSDAPITPEEIQQFRDDWQVLVLRRPTAARMIMRHVRLWVTEILNHD